jgi:ArsR family transcriptional regulator
MSEMHREMVKLFKVFGDENRIQILELLNGRELSAYDLLVEVQITQSTLSHHMKLLCDSDIVTARKDGKWVYYSLNKDRVEEAKDMLQELFEEKSTKDPYSTLYCGVLF